MREGADDLYLRPANLFVAGFFSKLNVFSTKVVDGHSDTPVGEVEADITDGAHVSVVVRLTGIDVIETSGKTQVRIISCRYLGVVELPKLAVASAEMPVSGCIPCGALSAKARDISLSLRKEDVLVFESRSERA